MDDPRDAVTHPDADCCGAVLPDSRCQWPSCLSEAEQQELADTICQGCYGEAVRTAGPYRLCEECRWEGE